MPASDTWFSLFGIVAWVVIIILLAYWFTKFVGTHGGRGGLTLGSGSEQLQVLARLSLGREQMLLLVQAGERFFLLGVTPSSIANLAEFTPEQAQSWKQEQQTQTPPSFVQALRTVVQQRKQR